MASKQKHEDLRQVLLIGLLADYNLTHTARGLAILNGTVAGQIPVGGKPVAFFQRFKVFGSYAEHLTEILERDSGVYVQGVLSYSRWTDNQEQTHEKLETIAHHVGTFAVEPIDISLTKNKKQVLTWGENRVDLTGYITGTPDFRYSPMGTPTISFRLAFKDNSKTYYADVHWHGEQADRVRLQAGQRVAVTGRLSTFSTYSPSTNLSGTGRRRKYRHSIEALRVIPLKGPKVTEHAESGVRDTSVVTPQPVTVVEEFPPEEDLPF